MENFVLPNLAGEANIVASATNTAHSVCIYDTLNNVGADSNTSYTGRFCPMFQVNTVPVGTTVVVQAKIHVDAEWIEIWRSATERAFIETYQMPYNFQRVVRISGSGDVKAFATMMPTDYMG